MFNYQEKIGTVVQLPQEEVGTVIRGKTTPELFGKIEKEKRLLTYRELICARIQAVIHLKSQFPEIQNFQEVENLSQEFFELMAQIKWYIWKRTSAFLVWMERFTTSTNLIRVSEDEICFWDYQLPQTKDKNLQDGGFSYESFLPQIKEEAYARISYEEYLQAKGGAFFSKEWRDHLVFKKACSNEGQQEKYVEALDILSSDSLYKPRHHSGWVQSGFPIGYGRPVALGFGEAAFYPPNNSTLDHAGIVVSNNN